MRRCLAWTVAVAMGITVAGCQGEQKAEEPAPAAASDALGMNEPEMISAATFPTRQVTGVTVTENGRLFVNFPYWDEQHDISVALVKEDGTLVPYPNTNWNTWKSEADLSPRDHFVTVQSVVADRDGSLWILDPASPMMQGVVEGGPKLVRVDLQTDQITRVYHFGLEIAPKNSYLNDVRVDNRRGFAYMTESGMGALVVLNLETGEARRVLADHPSTQAEDIDLVIGGKPLETAQGQTPQIHADGIALSPDRDWLYYHALTGRTLYRVPTAVLRDYQADEQAIARAVEKVAQTVATDGMLMDEKGNIYHTALEHDAIMAYNVDKGQMWTLISDPRLAWPDSLSVGPEGDLYVTTSLIHQMPRFNNGANVRVDPYHVWRIRMNLEQE